MKYGEVEGQLQAGEKIIENPTISRLYNATKISGRTPRFGYWCVQCGFGTYLCYRRK